MIELPEPTTVVCHDAGAANLILAEMGCSPNHVWRPVFQGPAALLWERAGSPGIRLWTLQDSMVGAACLLSGTGWATKLEHEARGYAQNTSVPSFAVIDHWVNYESRFERDGRVILPDEIWVFDEYASRLATETFPTIPVRLRPNLYLQHEIKIIRSLGPPRAGRVLFLGEPLRYTWHGLTKPGELEALDYLLSNIELLGVQGPLQIRLRPHPSDPPGKYEQSIARHTNFDLAIDHCESLSHAIAEAEWVAGCETAALVVALEAGKRAISTLPPTAPRCRLPHQKLLHLSDITKNDSKSVLT
jgi:hypothetical protein